MVGSAVGEGSDLGSPEVGVIPRVMSTLWQLIEERTAAAPVRFTVRVSFCELVRALGMGVGVETEVEAAGWYQVREVSQGWGWQAS
jgi:hypothetical protein